MAAWVANKKAEDPELLRQRPPKSRRRLPKQSTSHQDGYSSGLTLLLDWFFVSCIFRSRLILGVSRLRSGFLTLYSFLRWPLVWDWIMLTICWETPRIPKYVATLLLPHSPILVLFTSAACLWLRLRPVLPPWATNGHGRLSLWDYCGALTLVFAALSEGEMDGQSGSGGDLRNFTTDFA